ncbi:aryl sulfotransferase [Halarcobacter ebronensis]|uniref:Aryl sulfotransferase n=1 Tax=Halarcobacter ebronensis TaxID=1462615 RepID=A0A4Q0YAB6_9BACT|nr:aryl-sulfate sulfotransferase [Halarcobacter ebronensis]RXJ66943.1 aryl sulfotransferase [Halarcobacter ebronensis]
MLRKVVSSIAFAAIVSTSVSIVVSQDLCAGPVSRTVKMQGQLGKVIVNPYKVAPLTAVIDSDGKIATDISVTVLGKPNGGQDITYKVSDAAFLDHAGVPIFGLYDGYLNHVKVDYKLNGKEVHDTYKILTNPFQTRIVDGKFEQKPKVEVKKVAKGFENRLYMVTLMGSADYKDLAWFKNDKIHGAGEWLEPSEIYMVDTKGEIRWYLDTEQFYDKYGRNIDDTGRIMSINMLDNGDLLFAQSQKYFRYSLMGEKSFSRKLPRGYVDLSHEAMPMPNGHMLLRVAKKDYRIPGTKDRATTIRDVVIEVDEGGRVVDEFDFNKIMGNNVFRKDLIVGLDARAVCLNVDMNAEHIEVSDKVPYGDHASTGTGRNWAHINSISYDKSDDSIIVSMRHQGIVKVGRDKVVKWILAPNVGWTKDMSKKILTPVDVNGKKLNCERASCSDTDFDWAFTQHTAWLSPRGKNVGHMKTLSVFDNGDGRNLEQPAFKEDKYSRAVEFVIDEKNMTVKQTWQFGKEKGWDWYSPVTSSTHYETDTGTYNIMFGTAKMLTKNDTEGIIVEVDPKDNDIKLEMALSTDKKPGIYYRTNSIKPNELFKY